MAESEWTDVVEPVIAQLSDENADVANQAEESLSDLLTQEPAARPIVVAWFLNSTNDDERVRMTRAMTRVADDEGIATALARATVEDSNLSVRHLAASALGRAVQYAGVVDALLTAAQDPKDQVRQSAANSLRDQRNVPQVRDTLAGLVLDSSAAVKRAAMTALYSTGGPPLSSPPDAKGSATSGAAAREVRAAIDTLMSVIDDLLEADPSQVETAFLNDLKIELGDLDDLVARADSRDDFQVAVSRLERLQQSFLGIAKARTEVLQIANAIGFVINAAAGLA